MKNAKQRKARSAGRDTTPFNQTINGTNVKAVYDGSRLTDMHSVLVNDSHVYIFERQSTAVLVAGNLVKALNMQPTAQPPTQTIANVRQRAAQRIANMISTGGTMHWIEIAGVIEKCFAPKVLIVGDDVLVVRVKARTKQLASCHALLPHGTVQLVMDGKHGKQYIDVLGSDITYNVFTERWEARI